MKLKGYSAISTFSGKSGIRSAKYICQFTLLMFILSPVDFFISLVENLLLGLTPENFLKFNTFPEGVLEVLHVTFKSSGISLKECYGGLLWDVKITSYQWSISCTKRSWMELVLKDNTWEIYTRKLILPGSRNHCNAFLDRGVDSVFVLCGNTDVSVLLCFSEVEPILHSVYSGYYWGAKHT